MAITRTSWTDIIGSNASPTSLAAGAQTTGDIDCNGTNNLVEVLVKVSVSFGASPDGQAVVNVYGVDADAINEVDTEPLMSFAVAEATSTEKRLSFQVGTIAADTLRVEVDNQDTTDSVDVWASYIGAYL